MDALDLILLGRRLSKLGEQVLRASDRPMPATGVSLVLRDVLAHPGASINDIAERTTLPQSYVSESVAKLVDQGVARTAVDPADKRRTLVRVSGDHLRAVARRGGLPADAAVIEALGPVSPRVATQVLRALAMLCERFEAKTPGRQREVR